MKPAPACALVIFGITGDLTHRLLMPALYNLSRLKLLPERFSIIGVGRRELAVDELRGANAAHDPIAVCLSGGSTPQRLYELLREQSHDRRMPWERVQVRWFLDRAAAPEGSA